MLLFEILFIVLCFIICKGKFECALYGDYVGMFQKLFSQPPSGLPVIVMKFAKINNEKYFLDCLFYWFQRFYFICIC